MNELRVPKRRVDVHIRLASGDAHEVAIFLAEAAASHSGPERIVDLLNEGADFLPAVDRVDRIAFFNRSAIAVVEAKGYEPEADLALEGPDARQFNVEITLASGERIEGRVRFVLPPERSRLVDYLASSPPFLQVEQESGVAYVNKQHVVHVALAEE